MKNRRFLSPTSVLLRKTFKSERVCIANGKKTWYTYYGAFNAAACKAAETVRKGGQTFQTSVRTVRTNIRSNGAAGVLFSTRSEEIYS